MRPDAPFRGAKVALLHGDAVLTYLRDAHPHLPFPGAWDLPGGGREGAETPQRCALRELHEEFGLRLAEDRLIWHRTHHPDSPGGVAHFFGGTLSADEVAGIRFGAEGQAWRLMPAAAFAAHPGAVPHLRGLVAQFHACAAVHA